MVHRLSMNMILDRQEAISYLSSKYNKGEAVLNAETNAQLDTSRAHSFGTSIKTSFMTYTTGKQAQGECPRCNIGRPASGTLPLGMGRVRTCQLRLTLMESWSYSAPYLETSCIGPSPSRTSSSARRMGQCSQAR